MKNRIVAAAFAALLLSGCPADRFLGRYLVVNNSDSTITDLTLSVGTRIEKTWDQTLPSQGWIHSQRFPSGPQLVNLSWKDETGDHQQKISFANKVGNRSKADLYIELKPHGVAEWRIVPPPAQTGTVWALLPVYLLYCLIMGLAIGVPGALAAIIAYAVFKLIRTGFIATVQGLHGDRSVFQFTIREICLLTAVVALACGWLIHIWAARQ